MGDQTKEQKELFDLEKVFKDCEDLRIQEDIEYQKKIILDQCYQNRKNFKITDVHQKDNPSVERTLRKYENTATKWCCYYTDNVQELNLKTTDLLLPNITILTSHGAGFDHSEFYKLEYALGEKTCRWINFSFPGFDGFDERRGDFTAGTKDVTNLILELLDHLGHSFGGYLRNYFTLMYPHRVLAFISLSTHTINYNLGMRAWGEGILRATQQDKRLISDIQNDLKDEQKRKETITAVKKSFQYLSDSFGGQVEIPQDTKIIPQIKYFISNQHPLNLMDSYIFLDQNIPNMIVFGLNDEFIPPEKITELIYFYQNNTQRQSFKLKKTKEIQQILKDVDFDYEKDIFYDNFIIMFEKAGHTPHLKRPSELSQVLLKFIQLIDHLHSINQLKHLNQYRPRL